eukprot:PhF_6_TR38112/c0_g1_i2/m.56881
MPNQEENVNWDLLLLFLIISFPSLRGEVLVATVPYSIQPDVTSTILLPNGNPLLFRFNATTHWQKIKSFTLINAYEVSDRFPGDWTQDTFCRQVGKKCCPTIENTYVKYSIARNVSNPYLCGAYNVIPGLEINSSVLCSSSGVWEKLNSSSFICNGTEMSLLKTDVRYNDSLLLMEDIKLVQNNYVCRTDSDPRTYGIFVPKSTIGNNTNQIGISDVTYSNRRSCTIGSASVVQLPNQKDSTSQFSSFVEMVDWEERSFSHLGMFISFTFDVPSLVTTPTRVIILNVSLQDNFLSATVINFGVATEQVTVSIECNNNQSSFCSYNSQSATLPVSQFGTFQWSVDRNTKSQVNATVNVFCQNPKPIEICASAKQTITYAGSSTTKPPESPTASPTAMSSSPIPNPLNTTVASIAPELEEPSESYPPSPSSSLSSFEGFFQPNRTFSTNAPINIKTSAVSTSASSPPAWHWVVVFFGISIGLVVAGKVEFARKHRKVVSHGIA